MADNYDVTKDRWPSDQDADWPARRAIAVTPSDTKDVTNGTGDNSPFYYRALYIGVTGDVTVITVEDRTPLAAAGTPVTFKAHPVGYMPVMVRRVMSTGTTATNIVGLFN